ncbi:MAG TPA: hypothetical protein VK753_05135 [Xanthomonadaceae bacterium]|jgi:hypothetical protein|nr:hypothetical protein [Xanthomonadaceae bacterium]
MLRILVLSLALVSSAAAFAQNTTVPTNPAPVAKPRHAVDMVSCRDGTKAMAAMRERICSTHGGVGPPAPQPPASSASPSTDN